MKNYNINPQENSVSIILLCDIKNGNPNGDPENDNMPRTNSIGHGIMTDVCIKRKIRNYIEEMISNKELSTDTHDIYFKNNIVLGNVQKDAKNVVDSKNKKADVSDYTKYMCEKYYDVRTFGAVMNITPPMGTVRGPVQVSISETYDEVLLDTFMMTRQSVAKAKPNKKSESEDESSSGTNQTFGFKPYMEYGLFKVSMNICCSEAIKSGFNESDLDILIESLTNMFSIDQSACRNIILRKIVVVKHPTKLLKYVDTIHNRLLVAKNNNETECPRSYMDYNIQFNKEIKELLENAGHVITDLDVKF